VVTVIQHRVKVTAAVLNSIAQSVQQVTVHVPSATVQTQIAVVTVLLQLQHQTAALATALLSVKSRLPAMAKRLQVVVIHAVTTAVIALTPIAAMITVY
jgi:hypothetical protein